MPYTKDWKDLTTHNPSLRNAWPVAISFQYASKAIEKAALRDEYA